MILGFTLFCLFLANSWLNMQIEFGVFKIWTTVNFKQICGHWINLGGSSFIWCLVKLMIRHNLRTTNILLHTPPSTNTSALNLPHFVMCMISIVNISFNLIYQKSGTHSKQNYGIIWEFSFILHLRPLGTFLVFTKKLKFCHYFYIYFWE